MSHSDKRALLATIAVLMVLSSLWFGSPWPLVALAGMGFALLLATGWAEHDQRGPDTTEVVRRVAPPPPWQRPE